MCGIAGYISDKRYEKNVIKNMTDSIKHRGPDDSGELVLQMRNGKYIGLGHRRLSILDLSVKGHQPMCSDYEGCTIVYNGEIYNFKELSHDLENQGIKFDSSCDTEVLLKAYEVYGIDFIEKLNGMFAFAIYDSRSDEVILARDRIGKKPLYYYFDHETLIWGSGLGPLMQHPEFRKEIRTELVSQYLCNKYINSPDTIFSNTYKVEPGEIIIYRNGFLEKRKYWDILEVYNKLSRKQIVSYDEVKASTKLLIEDSVERRLMADVPVGALLSGGIDSTLISAVAQNKVNGKLKTFTVGFETKEENEAPFAKEIAGTLGTDHTEIYVSQNELLDIVNDLSYYFDEPFADSSQIPTMAIAEVAKRDVSVILSGDGGDELFCGYKRYDWARWAQRADGLGNLLSKFCTVKLQNSMPDKIYAWINNRDEGYKTQLFTDVRQRYTRNLVISNSIEAKYSFESAISEPDWQIRRMLVDMNSYLPDEVLCKVDRATMKYSLEGRNPLVDYRLIEHSFRIPHEYKYRNGCKKFILKDITYDYVDKKLLERPKKGFGVPLALWMRTTLNKKLREYADERALRRQGIFNPAEIRRFIDALEYSNKSVYNSIMWSFFVFQQWYQHYMEDLWA